MKKFIFMSIVAFILLISGCKNVETEQVKKQNEKASTAPIGITAEPEVNSITETAVDTEPEPPIEIIEITETIPDEIELTEETEEETAKVSRLESSVDSADETTQASLEKSMLKGYNKIGENGILVFEKDGHLTALMPCFGTYELCLKYAENLNEYAEALKNTKVYSMIIPTSVEFYLPRENNNFTGSQLNKINYITEELKNVTNIDAYGALITHKNEDIFARTDHHWLPLGGYYAAESFAKTAGVPFDDLKDYATVVKSGYVGSMYNYSNDINLYNDPEDFTMYIPKNEIKTMYYDTMFENGYESDLFVSPDGSAYYCSFLGSDDRIAKIETNANTGRTLVIFKESYGNALVPFLTSGFDTIYVCDIRYFGLNSLDFCNKVGATDVLFAVCTFTPAGNNGKYIGIIKSE